MNKNIRKIIPVGKTSYAIIIPISWLRFNDLKNGDLVEVISSNILKIRPIKKQGNL